MHTSSAALGCGKPVLSSDAGRVGLSPLGVSKRHTACTHTANRALKNASEPDPERSRLQLADGVSPLAWSVLARLAMLIRRIEKAAKLFLITWLIGRVHAQLTTVGFTDPQFTVAPGEVVTFFAQGLNIASAAFAEPPLPTVLSGVKVSVQNFGTPVGVLPYAADWPILSVKPWSCVVASSSGCGLTAVTIEVPTDLSLEYFIATISVNGAQRGQAALRVEYTSIHILSSCDSVISNGLAGSQAGCQILITPSPSVRQIYHPGDWITIWAVGLGATKPAVPTGQASTGIAPVSSNVSAFLDFNLPQVNGSLPAPTAAQDISSSVGYVGVSPGYVGLYQMNLQLPNAISTTNSNDCAGPNLSFIANTRVTITETTYAAGGSYMSTDSLLICLLPSE